MPSLSSNDNPRLHLPQNTKLTAGNHFRDVELKSKEQLFLLLYRCYYM